MIDFLIRSLMSAGTFTSKEVAEKRNTLMHLLPMEDKLDVTQEAQLAFLDYEDELIKLAFEKGLAAGIEFATKK